MKVSYTAPLEDFYYPLYFNEGKYLLAFVSKNEVYKIEPRGSNIMNQGLTIDYYKTRKMVLKYYPPNGTQVSEEKFKQLLQQIYSAYTDRIFR